MAERTDLDALMIGALYGELTPAEQAQLTTHLESHPADRTALADLTRTREAVRESRLLAMQLDPPPSGSALLLQEAARLAPKPPKSERESWFYRLTRALMAHPAMAAATGFVLVAGVAGTLYVKQGSLSSAPAPTAGATSDSVERRGAEPAAAPGAFAAAPSAPATAGATSGSAAYGVQLDEAKEAQRQVAQQAAPPAAEPQLQISNSEPSEGALAVRGAPKRKQMAKPAKRDTDDAIEMPTPKPAEVKDIDSADLAKNDFAGFGNAATRGATAKVAAASDKPQVPAPSKPMAAAAAKAPPPAAVASPDFARAPAAGGDDATISWAAQQREQVIALVKSNNCDAAATSALAIYNRAPGYYAANVANDRAIKPCLPYLNRQREIADRKAAAKRASDQTQSTETPAAAPAQTTEH